ncbi:MAG: hypothetical protein ACREBS_05345 [Nitrososphaerales archaeon]
MRIAPFLILGLIIREILAPFTGHPYDMELWVRIGYYVSMGHDPYSLTAPVPGLSFPNPLNVTWIGYPPIWAFFQAGLYKMYAISGLHNRFVYYLLTKQPMIIGDMLVSCLLLKIISNLKNERSAISALRFWMLCPFTIIISSVWGMFDQIVLVLTLGSILLVAETQKSALLEAFAFLLKVIPLIYLPVLAFAQKSKGRIASYLSVTIGASVFFALAPYVVFRNWNLSELVSVGVDVTHKLGNSMNYWGILAYYTGYFSARDTPFHELQDISMLWIPAILIASYFCVISIRGKENLEKNLTISMLFVTLVFFLSKSIINEQYLIYFLGFALIDYYLSGSRYRNLLFHGIWIISLIFLVANNDFLVRFLSPISTYYALFSSTFELGVYGEIRVAMMIAAEILFTVLTFLYMLSLYHELNMIRRATPPIANQ